MNLKYNLVWVLVWAMVILVLSTVGVGVSLPSSWMELFSWDKLAHALIYGVFSFLLINSFFKYYFLPQALFFGFIIGVIYGMLMEMVQYLFFPNRLFEMLDIAANTVGSFGSVLLFYFLSHKT